MTCPVHHYTTAIERHRRRRMVVVLCERCTYRFIIGPAKRRTLSQWMRETFVVTDEGE